MKANINTRTSLLLLVFVVLGVYYPAIFVPMNSIDDPGMYDYLLNMEGFSFREIFIPGGSGRYYRPLLIVSYMMDKYVWGLEVSFMHLENIVFHLMNALMLFFIVHRAALLQKMTPGLAPFAAAMLFAVHPINTEVVDWIAGRTDLLAAFFLFLSFLLLLSRKGSIVIPLSAAFFMFVACLGKETSIFFLPAALLFPFYLSRNGEKPSGIRETLLENRYHFIFFLIAGAAYFSLRSVAFSKGDEGLRQVYAHVAGGQSAGVMSHVVAVLKSSGFYLKKLFMPFPLNFAITQVSDFYIPVGVLLLVIMAWLAVKRTLPVLLFIASFSVGSSALLIPIIRQTWTPLAERYMYIPSAFLIAGLTIAITRRDDYPRYHKILMATVCAVAMVSVYSTVSRTLVWQDNLALFQDTLEKSPDFVPAQNEIANALFNRGRIREASAIIMSIQLPADLSNRQYGFISKAVAAKNSNDLPGARSYLYEALKDPGRHEVEILQRLLKLYDLELLQGNAEYDKVYPEMLRLLQRLYAITSDPFCQYRLGQIYMHHDERKLAQAAFSTAAAHAPENAYYRPSAKKLAARLQAEIGSTPDAARKPAGVQ